MFFIYTTKIQRFYQMCKYFEDYFINNESFLK